MIGLELTAQRLRKKNMGPLRNPRHEAFARALFENKSADEAYMTAGYSENRGNAARLKAKESIQSRVAELQAAAAKASEVTVQSLLNELEAAREKASNLDQLSAAVRAIQAKAQIAGLLTQKVELTTSIDDRFDEAETMEDVAAALAEAYGNKGYILTAEQRPEFARLIEGWINAIDDYVRGCAAKPVQPVHDLAGIERKRLGLRQIGNGSRR